MGVLHLHKGGYSITIIFVLSLVIFLSFLEPIDIIDLEVARRALEDYELEGVTNRSNTEIALTTIKEEK